MIQSIYRFVRGTGRGGWNLLFLLALSVEPVSADTLSFNSSGDFDSQFTRRAGSAENRFEEAVSIGVAGSRALRRSSTGTETVSYTSSASMGALQTTAGLSIRFNYSTNSTGSGGVPLFLGVSNNAAYNGSETGAASDDFIGVELSQRITGSNESKITIFNGRNGSRTESADSGFENLTPGWYELEVTTVKTGGLFDLSASLHRMSNDGSSRLESDVISAAISSLANGDVLNAAALHVFLGGSDTLTRGVAAIDELSFNGYGTAATISAPSGLVASPVSNSQINLTWSDNSNNELNFRVQRRQGSGTWGEIAVLPANSVSYSNTGLAQETAYNYRVVASNNETTSNPSNEVSASTSGAPVPNKPTNLVASAFSMTQVDLTWTDNSNNEDRFQIDRKVGNGTFVKLVDVNADTVSYSNTGLSPSTSYTYRIRSGNSIGLSAFSNEFEVTTPAVPVPVAPTNLRFTSTSVSRVSIAWNDNADDEQGYRVERKDGTGDFEQIAELAAGSTAFSDTEVEELGDYTYHVYAYNADGSSGLSNPISVLLPFLAPGSLSAQAISSAQVNLSWADNSGVETGFRIERKVGNGAFITLVNVGKDVTTFTDVTVNPQINYVYRIVGISFTHFSEYANDAAVTTPALAPPNAPAGLQITGQGLDHVVLQWNDNSGNEDGFRVQRKTGAGGFENLADLELEVTSYTDNQVNELDSYTYRILSFNEAGASTPSNEVITQIGFDHPTDLLAVALSSSQVELTWSDNSKVESGYRVERKSGQGSFEVLSTPDAGSSAYLDTDVGPVSAYTYRVVALSGQFESNPTNESSVTTPNIPAPGSAGNLVTSLVDNSYVSLNWTDNSNDEAGFRVERKVGSGGWSALTSLPANTTTFQDHQVGELETFSYRIVAFNDGGDSTRSNETSTVFTFIAPSNLTAQATAEKRIDLTWQDNSMVETGYRVERKTGAGAFVSLVTTPVGATAYVDETITVGVVYTYRVVGVYTGGQSTPTNEISATTSADTTKPNTPTDLAATALDFDQVHVTWTDASDNESGFRIERKAGAGGSFILVGTVEANATSFTDKDLETETTYFYRVAAFISGARSSDNSAEASATTLGIPLPSAPSMLEIASQSAGVVSLSWQDNSLLEAGFKIQRKSANGSFEDLATVNENVTFYNDDTVAETQTYQYRVFGYNAAGNSEFSNESEAFVPFAAPQLLVGDALASTQVQLTWVDSSKIETGYRVERKTESGGFEVIGSIGVNSILYLDAGVIANSTYSYRVIAIRSGAESLPSNIVNVTTPNIPLPEAPTGLQVEALSDTSTSLVWTDNSENEMGFRIYRRVASEGVWVEIGAVEADVNLFVDTNALPGVNYSYRITAYNAGGMDSPAESDFRIPIAGRLINISTRGLVENGDNVMIGSFIVQGDGPKTILLRGIGPSISSAIDAPILNDPEITLVSGADLNNPIAYNDDWKDTDEAGVIASGLPPQFDTESALVIRLQPGAYSAILSGVDYSTGFGLLEVYEVDYAKNIRLVNISTRSFVQEGDKRMIGGFVVDGDTPTRVFIRATGPSLPDDIENRLPDPVIELYAESERIGFNDNWLESDQIGDIIATGIPPTNESEAALVATLEPGAYTAIVGGAGESSGYSLLEIYYYPEQ